MGIESALIANDERNYCQIDAELVRMRLMAQ